MRHPDFNPHFRKGSDASPFGLNFVILVISIHTSAREVTQVPVMQKTGKLYFNPHFRKGSDHNYTVVYAVFMISIHTSAREVTNPDPKLDPVSYISIHTSAREVTYPVRNIPASPGNFNPHFRKGSDRSLDRCSVQQIYFNPHFRKGSDRVPCTIRVAIRYFNPHFRKGSDEIAEVYENTSTEFQSTLPQGK